MRARHRDQSPILLAAPHSLRPSAFLLTERPGDAFRSLQATPAVARGTLIGDVTYHSNDFERRIAHRIGDALEPHESDSTPNRVFIGKIGGHKLPVHHCYVSRVVDFSFGKCTSPLDWNVQHAKVCLAHVLHLCMRLLLGRFAGDLDLCFPG
jgi:hypothetical protein